MARYYVSPLFILIGILQIITSTALRFEVSPEKFDGTGEKNIQFSCETDETDKDVNEVLILNIEGKGQGSLARGDKLKTEVDGREPERYQVYGCVSPTCDDNFLTLTLLKPKAKDSGDYTCVMYHKDTFGLLKQKRVTKTLSVKVGLKMTIRSLHESIVKLQAAINNKKLDSSISTSIPRLLKSTTDQDKRVKTLVETDAFVTAFSAALDTEVKFSKGVTLVFPQVIMHKGQGYDNMTGVFTAPRDGTYLFFLKLGTAKSGEVMEVSLTVNDRQVAKMDIGHKQVSNNPDENSINSVNQLKTGDKVKVVMGDQGQGYFRNETISMFGCYGFTPMEDRVPDNLE